MKLRFLLLLTVLIPRSSPAQTLDNVLTQTYKLQGFSFAYPGSWQVQSGKNNNVTIAPATARTTTRSGGAWLSNGLYAGILKSPSTNVEQSAEALFESFRKSDSHMTQLGGGESLQVRGRSGYLVQYSNSNPDAPAPESGVVAVFDVGNGENAYLVLFCPSSQQYSWFPVFRRIMETASFNADVQRGSGSGGQHVFVEPWQTLVRDTVNVNAGQSLRYNFTFMERTKLLAEFQVQGGLNNRIQVWLLDAENFQRYAAGQAFNYFTGTSGAVRGLGKYEFNVPQSGLYYVVLDNAKAWFMPRSVTLHLDAILPQVTSESQQIQTALETQYSMLNRVFIFPEFQTFVRHCGVVNAFSNPNITICTEMIEELQGKGLGQTVGFVYLHELGHTLMKEWGLPLWDNEDAADEFATALLLIGKHQDLALQAAQYWATDRVTSQDAVAKIWMDDRHSLSPQRARNIIRWVNNSNEIVPRWEHVFIPNMQTEALQSMLRDPNVPEKDFIRSELTKRGVTARAF